MILDAHDLLRDTSLHADICIAGAGAAGITIARDLIGQGLSVCVLESGGYSADAATQDLYRGTLSGIDTTDLTTCRLRYFGGSTNHWTGWCRELDPDDFRPRSWIPGSGWPLSHDDLAPYYSRARATAQIGDRAYAEDLSRDSGMPLLPVDPDRVQPVVYELSPPVRFGTDYRSVLEQAENVTVYLNANITEIRLDENGDRVHSFIGTVLDGPAFSVEAEHYVLGLGGIENARMLLASNRQEPQGIGNRHDLVGRHFMDHPHFRPGAFLVSDEGVSLDLYTKVHDNDGTPARVALSLGPDVRSEERTTTLSCILGERDPDVAVGSGKVTSRHVAEFLESSGHRVSGVIVRAEQVPNRESRVKLGAKTDALGIPEVDLDWRVSSRDLLDIGRSLSRLGSELGKAGIGRLWVPLEEDGSYRAGEIYGGCHHMGTTRMSTSPLDGVVDADCRVHGVANLFVAGSSVFPTAGYANPTLTLLALAHRLADHLGAA